MDQLTESIRQQGVLTPLVVRPINNDEYEVISGHWRLHACQKAGIEMIPAFIYFMNRGESVVTMVDSNLHWESLRLENENGCTKVSRNFVPTWDKVKNGFPHCQNGNPEQILTGTLRIVDSF